MSGHGLPIGVYLPLTETSGLGILGQVGRGGRANGLIAFAPPDLRSGGDDPVPHARKVLRPRWRAPTPQDDASLLHADHERVTQ